MCLVGREQITVLRFEFSKWWGQIFLPGCNVYSQLLIQTIFIANIKVIFGKTGFSLLFSARVPVPLWPFGKINCPSLTENFVLWAILFFSQDGYSLNTSKKKVTLYKLLVQTTVHNVCANEWRQYLELIWKIHTCKNYWHMKC